MYTTCVSCICILFTVYIAEEKKAKLVHVAPNPSVVKRVKWGKRNPGWLTGSSSPNNSSMHLCPLPTTFQKYVQSQWEKRRVWRYNKKNIPRRQLVNWRFLQSQRPNPKSLFPMEFELHCRLIGRVICLLRTERQIPEATQRKRGKDKITTFTTLPTFHCDIVSLRTHTRVCNVDKLLSSREGHDKRIVPIIRVITGSIKIELAKEIQRRVNN